MTKRNGSKRNNWRNQQKNDRSQRRAKKMSPQKKRIYENPGRALNLARGVYSVTGLFLGAIAAGIAILTDAHFEPPSVYFVNIGVLYMTRYLGAIIYGAMVRIQWKVNADEGHPDEFDYVSDHRYLDAWTATMAACLGAVTLVLTHSDTPSWMKPWWIVTGGTAFIGAVTMESLLSFTPMWFYINILRRFPQRNP